ncbi:MAG: ferritin-like domain-containing protein [Alphaproteobacteria bacterium]|nr:ferritin-like domain-containing protein [Alphaproteobacteria bacterium]
MHDEIERRLALSLSLIAMAGCGAKGEPRYEGDYGDCDPDDVDALQRVEAECHWHLSDDRITDCEIISGAPSEPVDALVVCATTEPEMQDCFDDEIWGLESRSLGDQAAADWATEGANEFWDAPLECGPMELDGACCWQYSFRVLEDDLTEGRPFLVHGRARTAGPAVRDDWAATLAPAPVPASLVPVLAEHWRRAGRMEHASVAAFARFSLALLHHGAPPDLVADAQRAALDEVGHARLCYGLAQALDGQAVGPGPLDCSAALDGELDAAQLVRTLVVEGCVGETLAALEAAEAARRAEDPVVAEILQRIAADEARHAALAWRALQWFLSSRPELAAVVAEASEPPHIRSVEDAASSLDAYGRLSAATRARVRAIGWRTAVAPMLQSAAHGVPRQDERQPMRLP